MLFPTPKLSADDERVLSEIESAREELKQQVSAMSPQLLVGMRKSLTAASVAASNSIEGFRVSAVDVEDLLEGEHEVDVSDVNRAETLAYLRTMAYVQSLHDVADFSYSKGLLNGLHWMLQGHRHSDRKPAGQWRRAAVYVAEAGRPRNVVYTAPGFEDVPDLMGELVDWLNADDQSHPLVRAAMAHLNLVSIHPWADGNGRMSRSLQTLMITREGVLAPEFSSIETWFWRNTWEYYRELASRGAEYLPDQDVSSWVRFNLKAYHQRAQVVLRTFDRSACVWLSLSEFAKSAGHEERVVSALHDAAMAGRVRRSRYEHAEQLSLQQAQRDLRDLVTAGVLEPVGRTRARYYTVGERFPQQALDLAEKPMTLTDPYARRA